MEKIVFNEILFAIIVRENFHTDGVFFFTDGSSSLEMGYMSHPAGYKIIPHKHPPYLRQTETTQEVLFLKSGRLKVNFFSNFDIYVGNAELNRGDWIILLNGGHGFEAIEPSVLFEIKNGPYAFDKDKVRFEPLPSKEIN